MSRFYRHSAQQETPEALAAAQREMISNDRWRNPGLWGAFQLTGAAADLSTLFR